MFEVEQVLKSNDLTINEINVNTKVKFKISKEGEFQVVKLKKDNKKIIPAVTEKGEAVSLNFNIPFKIIN